jgi:WD40 repeat protein
LFAFLAFLIIRKRSNPPVVHPLLHLSVTAPPESNIGQVALSPDGRYLAFTSLSLNKQLLIIRTLASGETRIIPEVEKALDLFWSPDSCFIGYNESNTRLKAAPVSGGRPREICNARGGGATWNQEGVILFTEFWGTGLFRVSSEGGEVTPVTTLNTAAHEGVHLWPHFLPDGRHFLFLVRSMQPETSFIWVGALNSSEARRRLIQADALIGWADPDQVLFSRGDALFAQSFDAKSFTFYGSPRMLSDSVAYYSADSQARATCSRNGILAYKLDAFPTRQLTWLDRTGQPTGVIGPATMLFSFRISPEESSLLISKFDRRTGSWNLWRIDAATGAEDRLTFLRNGHAAVWSPDSSEIIYDSDEFIMFNLYRRRVDKTTPEQPIYRNGTDDKRPTDWSRDGKYLLFDQLTEKNSMDLWFLSVDDPSHPQPLLLTEADEQDARFSPDGRWIAYSSTESGRAQVYLQPFPKGGSRVPVSREGGDLPVWNPNGKELFFLDPERTLMAVELKTDNSGIPKPEPPKALFRRPGHGKSQFEGYDVSRDGQRFLFPLDAPALGSENITVLVNWAGEPKR